MYNIEFVGPSCIGKSKFLKNLIKYKDNSSWTTDKKILKQLPSRNLNIGEKIARKVIKAFDLNFSFNEEDDVFNKINEFSDECALIVELFHENLKYLDYYNSIQKTFLIDYWTRKFLFEKILLYEMSNGEIVVNDEGFIQNTGLTPVVENFYKYKNITESPLFPKAVIFCELNADLHLERIHSRFREKGKRIITGIRDNVTDAEVESYMIKSRDELNLNREACKMLKLPYLNMEPVSVKSNFDRVLKFIDITYNKETVITR